MPSDSKPVQINATVLRVSEKQLRLRLDDEANREVIKRIELSPEVREKLEGATIAVTLNGTGARARVDLAEDLVGSIIGAKKSKPASKAKSATAKKPAAAKKPASKKPAAAKKPKAEAETPAADAKQETAEAAAPEQETAAKSEPTGDATAKADSTTENNGQQQRSEGGRSRSRSRRNRRGKKGIAAKVPTLDPKLIVSKIEAAAELLRSARR